MIKEAIFNSNIALYEWKKRNYPFVVVLSVATPDIIFGVDVSSRLKSPNITVTYLEFPREME